jgi:hypothetical protein
MNLPFPELNLWRVSMDNEYSFLDSISSGKFHSCIISTFSFDFYFFEMNVLSRLRGLGISNIHILVDQSMLQKSLGEITGNLSHSNRSYTISGIRSKGAFHPKVMLLFGEKEGFLTIGSGNLTSSGYGRNFELWGAFHISDINHATKQIFLQCWSFIRNKLKDSTGIIKEKIMWAEKFSKWIDSKYKYDEPAFSQISKKCDSALLTNEKKSILSKLFLLIPSAAIKKITIISPFVDHDSKTLIALAKYYINAEIIFIGQKNYIGFPDIKKGMFNNRISFYKWKDEQRNLHAKMIHFQSDNNTEYVLFGSANLTSAGMGTIEKHGKNSEISLLMKRSNGNWLNDLELQPAIEPITSEELQLSDRHEYSEEHHRLDRLSLKLLALDLHGNRLNIIVNGNKESNSELYLKLYNSWGDEKDSHKILLAKNAFNKTVMIKHKNLFYGQISDNKNRILSNKQLVNNVEAIWRTYPSKRFQKLEILLSEIETGNKRLFDIFQYLPLRASDKSSKPNMGKGKDKKGQKKSNTSDAILNYKGELPLSSVSSSKNNRFAISSDIIRIFETLNRYIISQSKSLVEESISSEEEESSSADSSTDRRIETKIEHATNIVTIKLTEKNRIFKYYKSYISYHQKLLKTKRVSSYDIDEIAFFNASILLLFLLTELKVNYADDSIEFDVLIPLRSQEKCGSIIHLDDFYGICTQMIVYFTLSLKHLKSTNSKYYQRKITEQKRDAYFHSMLGTAILKYLLINDKAHFEKTFIDNFTNSLFDIIHHRTFEKSSFRAGTLEKMLNNKYSKIVNFSNQLDFENDILTEIIEKHNEYKKKIKITKDRFNEAKDYISKFIKL